MLESTYQVVTPFFLLLCKGSENKPLLQVVYVKVLLKFLFFIMVRKLFNRFFITNFYPFTIFTIFFGK